ncbi:MAG: isoprenylcysteine carboxylmethyltransferase family protein [Deltaproteobacteria bacterium]|nr:isoprenylcysteine carboxylmethyltransferase family protein [Deltaproteobacteria bacterium]
MGALARRLWTWARDLVYTRRVFSTTNIVVVALGALWFAAEVTLSVRRRADPARSRAADRSTFWILTAVILGFSATGLALGVAGVGFVPAFYPELAWTGVSLTVAGITLRWTAIHTLKQFFTVNVAISSDHRVIQHGVYRLMRHPSYTGGLLGVLGVGLAFCSWASTVVLFIPMTIALLHRIRVEEAALREGLGAAYADYCRRTARLIPWIY